MKQTKIAIIGTGNISQKVYLPLLCNDPEVDVVGVMGRRETAVKKISEQYRIYGTTQFAEILKKEPEAVFIHTSTESHYELVKKCLLEGLPVYVDKPLSYLWNETKELVSLAEKKDLLLAVGFNRRFAPLYQEAKKWISEKGSFDYCMAEKHRNSKQKASAEITIYDDVIHIIDLLFWLGDDNYKINSHIEQKDNDGKLIYAVGSMCFHNNSIGNYSMVRTAGINDEKLTLHGNNRSAEVTDLELLVLNEKEKLSQMKQPGSWESIFFRRGFTGAVKNFLMALSDPQSCSIRGEAVLSTHEFIKKITG